MQLTARQVELLNSTNPADNPELLASLGGDEQLLHKLVNMFGPGGSQYNATNYGKTSSSLGARPDQMFWKAYQDAGIMDASGNMLKHQDNNGNWVDGAPGGTFSAMEVDPGQSWSGVNAQGGFTGGTGTGITTPGVTVNANGTYSPVTAQSLMAAMGGGTGAGTLGATTGGTGAGGIGEKPNYGGSNTGTGETWKSGISSGTGTTGSVAPAPTTPAAGPAVSGNPMDYFDTAGYKFRMKEAQDAINNTAAARGNALSGPAAMAGMQYASDLASQEYDKAFGRMTNARDYTEGVRRYDTTLGENRRQFDSNLGENQRQFDEGTRRWGLNFDQNVATSDRDFDESVRRYDLTTNLGQANNDRAFSYGTLKDLATLGLGGANSSSDLSKTLAQLLTGGTLAGGGALAGGTIGGANATNSMASQLLNLIFGNNLVSSLQPKP